MCETVCVVLSAPSMRFEVKVFVWCFVSCGVCMPVCVLRAREEGVTSGTPMLLQKKVPQTDRDVKYDQGRKGVLLPTVYFKCGHEKAL